jgi:drug/metabolite transporter (DMT)-like permease
MNGKPYIYHLSCFLAIVAWSTIELASKYLSPGISPFTVTAWRFLIGGVVILPFALFTLRNGRSLPGIRDFLMMVLMGVLIVCVSMLLLQLSVYYGKASLSAVLVGSNPLFVSLFAVLILHEKIRLVQLVGLAVALAGILMLIGGEADFAGGKYLNLPYSVVFGLAAAVTFGLYTVLTRNLVVKHGNLITNTVSFLGGSLLLFIFNAATGKPILLQPAEFDIPIMLWLGAVVSGLAYLMFFEAVKKLGAARSSMYFFLKPALASLLAVLLLHEHLGALQIVSIAVIIAGLVIFQLLRPTV